MKEFKKNRSEEHPEINILDEIEDLENILEEISTYVGRIIIEFNSLEDSIEYCIAEQISNSGSQDDRIYVFLAEMNYHDKTKALINLYGQIIESCHIKYTQSDLNKLEKMLNEAAKTRNEYAHAKWENITKKRYVCVKTQANKKGIFQKYKLFNIDQMKDDLIFIEKTQESLFNFDENVIEQLFQL